MEIELRFPLQPKQQLFRKKAESTHTVFYGGAKGGGKSHGLRNIMLLRRFLYPGTHGGIFRRTFPELEANHIRKLFTQFPSLRDFYHEGKKILTIPNRSTLQFCHCKDEKDVNLYQGVEFNDLGIDEVGQWPESMFRTLQTGSNRSTVPGVKPRTLLTGNPGGIGHKWIKRLFIERNYNERENPEDYDFIQALVQDNEALMKEDPDYVRRLEAEPNETLRKAFLYGDWDIFAGQFFSEIRRNVHMIKPFEIPDHWNRFGAYDYGFNHPGAFAWFAVDEDGTVYLYREFIRAQLRVDQFASEILKFKDTEKLTYITAGHDCWQKRGIGPTIAEEFGKFGLYIRRANIDRIQGASQVRNYLAWQDMASGRNVPKFQIFETCPISFDCLTRMQHDPNRVEDVLKVDAVEGDPFTGDDAYDMIRMGLMSRPILTQPLPKKKKWGYDSGESANRRPSWMTT